MTAEQSVVIYSDGGCNPNPGGPSGYGLHGYIYVEVEPKKGLGLGDVYATATGYRSKSQNFGSAEKEMGLKNEAVTVVSYIDGFGAIGAGTNNSAELSGAIAALEFVSNLAVKEVKLICDSMYVLDGFNKHSKNWVRNNWKTSTGEPVKNQELWKRLLEAHNNLIQRGVAIYTFWTKGHSTLSSSIGNVTADTLATMGVEYSRREMDKSRPTLNISSSLSISRGVSAPVVSTNSTTTNGVVSYRRIDQKPADGYWKTDVNKHPLLCLKKMYFNTLKEKHIPNVFFMGNQDNSDVTLGTRSSYGAFGVVHLKEPDDMLVTLVKNQQYVNDYNERLVVVDLGQFYNPNFQRDLKNYGDMAYSITPSSANAKTHDRGMLCEEFDPPANSYRAATALSSLYDELVEIEAREFKDSPGVVVNEITDVLYEDKEVAKKGVTTVAKALYAKYNVGFANLKVKVKYDQTEVLAGTGECDLNLVLGVDIPDRNALKNIENDNPRVFVVTVGESSSCFRYFTVIVTDNALAAFAGIYTNTRFII